MVSRLQELRQPQGQSLPAPVLGQYSYLPPGIPVGVSRPAQSPGVSHTAANQPAQFAFPAFSADVPFLQYRAACLGVLLTPAAWRQLTFPAPCDSPGAGRRP